MPSRWWRFGQDGGKPPAGWAERVKADVEASRQRLAESARAVDEAIESAGLGPAVDAPSPEPGRSESVREFLLRTPHGFELDLQAHGGPGIRVCACGMWPGAVIHHGETLMSTRAYLEGIRREMEPAGPGEGPAEALPDREREAPEEEAAGEDSPETMPIRKPEPLPDGVLGYSVATRRTLPAPYGGGALGWLATADLMTREAAEHTLSVTGGTLVEVRAVKR